MVVPKVGTTYIFFQFPLRLSFSFLLAKNKVHQLHVGEVRIICVNKIEIKKQLRQVIKLFYSFSKPVSEE